MFRLILEITTFYWTTVLGNRETLNFAFRTNHYTLFCSYVTQLTRWMTSTTELINHYSVYWTDVLISYENGTVVPVISCHIKYTTRELNMLPSSLKSNLSLRMHSEYGPNSMWRFRVAMPHGLLLSCHCDPNVFLCVLGWIPVTEAAPVARIAQSSCALRTWVHSASWIADMN